MECGVSQVKALSQDRAKPENLRKVYATGTDDSADTGKVINIICLISASSMWDKKMASKSKQSYLAEVHVLSFWFHQESISVSDIWQVKADNKIPSAKFKKMFSGNSLWPASSGSIQLNYFHFWHFQEFVLTMFLLSIFYSCCGDLQIRLFSFLALSGICTDHIPFKYILFLLWWPSN